MDLPVCPVCKKTFTPNHGNRVYCGDACRDKYKATKQKENNAIVKEFRKGFLHNYKLFQQLLPDPGSTSLPLWNLLPLRFDQNAFYGTVRDKEKNEWRKVNEYYFRIVKEDDQPILFLFKK